MTLATVAFETFGAQHLIVMALIAVVAIGLTWLVRRRQSVRLGRGVAVGLAVVLLANEVAFVALGLATAERSEFLQRFLPIHICGVAAYMTAWALVRGGRIPYELTYFWGLSGALQATLTPNLQFAFPSVWFWFYFISHGGIVTGAIYATWALGHRPGPRAILRVCLLTNLYMAFVAIANGPLDANYMFLREPPAGASPFFFLPWPWYILFLEVVGLGIITLLNLPFVVERRLAPRAGARSWTPPAIEPSHLLSPPPARPTHESQRIE